MMMASNTMLEDDKSINNNNNSSSVNEEELQKIINNTNSTHTNNGTSACSSLVESNGDDRSSMVSSSDDDGSFEGRQDDIYHHPDFSHRGMIHKMKSNDSSSSSILWQFIKQLQPQVDLLRMCSPIFIMRPISTLELYTYYTEPTLALKVLREMDSELDRMLCCLLFSLISCSNTFGDSFEGLKPYNPILGEEFHAEWHSSVNEQQEEKSGEKKTAMWLENWLSSQTSQDQERMQEMLKECKTKVTAEQVSHHPPISAFLMENEKCGWSMKSTFQILAKLKMNYVDLNIAGKHLLQVDLKNGETEEYDFTLPHVYANGLFWGSSTITNGEYLKVKCKKSGLTVKLNFGSGNDVSGSLTDRKGKTLLNLKGNICGKINITKGNSSDLYPSTLLPLIFKSDLPFFEATFCKSLPFSNELVVKPLHEQKEYESRRVWHEVTYNILHDNKDKAFDCKHEIEEIQRAKASKLKLEGKTHETKIFKPTGDFSKHQNIPLYEK